MANSAERDTQRSIIMCLTKKPNKICCEAVKISIPRHCSDFGVCVKVMWWGDEQVMVLFIRDTDQVMMIFV